MTEPTPQAPTRRRTAATSENLLTFMAVAIVVLLIGIVRSVDIRRTQGTREGRLYLWAQASGRQLLHVFPDLTKWAVVVRRWADEVRAMTDPMMNDR